LTGEEDVSEEKEGEAPSSRTSYTFNFLENDKTYGSSRENTTNVLCLSLPSKPDFGDKKM
jgi:hypothetical protein